MGRAIENPKQDAVVRPQPRWRGTLRAHAPYTLACGPPYAGRCTTGGVQLAPGAGVLLAGIATALEPSTGPSCGCHVPPPACSSLIIGAC